HLWPAQMITVALGPRGSLEDRPAHGRSRARNWWAAAPWATPSRATVLHFRGAPLPLLWAASTITTTPVRHGCGTAFLAATIRFLIPAKRSMRLVAWGHST